MIKKNIEVYTLIESEINKLKRVGIETASLDCRLLLSKSLNIDKTLYNHQIINISENGASNFIEIGPGKVLTGMVKRTLTNVKSFSINSIADIKNLKNEFKK